MNNRLKLEEYFVRRKDDADEGPDEHDQAEIKTEGAASRTPPYFLFIPPKREVSKENGGPAGSMSVAKGLPMITFGADDLDRAPWQRKEG